MIVCVSPSSSHYDETHNTLKYADRAKRIKTKVSRNLIDVNRHVGQYVQTIYKLQQEVAQLKKRNEDVTKEAVEKLKKEMVPRDLAMRDASSRLKSAYELSKELRSSRLADLKNLRFLQKRTALVNAWLHAFDAAFGDRMEEPLPNSLFKIRQSAEKLLRDMEDNQQSLNIRMSGDGPEKAIDTALGNILKGVRNMQGISDIDINTINAEAALYKTMIERDIFHGIAESEVEASNSVYILAQSQFQAIATMNSIINMDEEEATQVLKKSLAETAQSLIDAASHIVSPNGEAVSTEALYNPSMMGTPKKKRKSSMGINLGNNMASPMKSPVKSPKKAQFPIPNANSPARQSPRVFKAPLPKLAVQFKKKEKKNLRVRWQDEEADSEDQDIAMDMTSDMPPPPQLSLPALQQNLPPPAAVRLPQEQFLPSRQPLDGAPSQSFLEATSAPRRSEAQMQAPMRPPVRPAVRSQPDTSIAVDAPAASSTSMASTQSSAPVRSSHLQAGFLAKKSHNQGSPNSPPLLAQASTSSNVLQEADVRRIVSNAARNSPLSTTEGNTLSVPSTTNDDKPRLSASYMRGTTSSTSRRSSTGSNSSQRARRRSPSAAYVSPNVAAFGQGHMKRMPKAHDKENGISVLTPKPVRMKDGRRLTVTATSTMSKEALERALAEMTGTTRDSTGSLNDAKSGPWR